ncbi:MAG: hydrogenase maturation protease [Coriobacteriia bacterium]
MLEPNPRILVLGIGNILMMDEGVGNRIASDLEANYVFPSDVRVMDAGTMGLGMIHLFRGVEFLLMADAIDGSGHPPGTVVRVSPEDFAPNQVLHSLHDVRLVDVLNAAAMIGVMPEADCIGVQVENMSPETLTIGLTATVEAAVPRAIAAVLHVLEERGVSADPAETGDPSLHRAVAEAKADIARRQAEHSASS